MAYTCWYSGNLSSSTDYFNAVSNGFTALGWTQYDSFTSTYPYKVFKSSGENNKYVPAYVEFWHENGLNVYFRYWLYWNNITHVGTVRGFYHHSYSYLYFTSGYPMHFYGNKDMAVLYTVSSDPTMYVRCLYFGHIFKLNDSKLTLTTSATSGNNKVLTVSGTLDKFMTERNYIILGSSTEGRYPIYITQINGGTVTGTITVSNLPINYASGAIIEHSPSTFNAWNFNGGSYGYRGLCDYNTVGITDNPSAFSTAVVLLQSDLDPDTKINRCIFQPIFIKDGINSTPIGYITHSGIGIHPLSASQGTYSKSNFFSEGGYESGTSTNSSTTTKINDTTKAWATNLHKGKTMVLVDAGTGIAEGQTRIITSNDATNLYWSTPLHTAPVSGNTYRIYNKEVFRAVGPFACKENIT